MNRKERRDYIKRMKRDMFDSGMLRAERAKQVQYAQNKMDKKHLEEGTKVKLKYGDISKRFNSETNPEWMNWVNDHKDDIFTVQYEEKHKEKKAFCVFKEDTSIVKWLWFSEDLEVVKGN